MAPPVSPARSESVVILCGGRGTRLQEHTRSIAKPLVEIGGHPILWHVIRIYAVQGWRRFVMCLGHRGQQIEDFVRGAGWPEGVEIRCVDTGGDTPTGERIARVRAHVGEGTFCATYADGVADIDLSALAAFHDAHDEPATLTVVRPALQFGFAHLDGDGRVLRFDEKPRSSDWVNGGFFRFEPAVFDQLAPGSVLEREPFAALAAAGQLRAFRHEGFWDCMDTYKDAATLNELWAQGRAPWKLWD
jgi:glucose-1-phosphate cytidylyltransferase